MLNSPRLLFFAVFLMAGSAILYELLLASALSYLLGATVLYFSLAIGIFLFALGVGAWVSKYIVNDLLQKFLTLEALLGILGGCAVPFIFLLYSYFFQRLGVLYETLGPVETFLRSGGFEFSFKTLSFLYLFGIGVLVGVELPIFTRLTNEFLALKEALARVFFWDYLGSLGASILFPLLLLPYFGFLRTGFLVGAVNLLAALILAWAMASNLPRSVLPRRDYYWGFSWPGRIILIAGLIALVLGFIFSPALEEFFVQKIFAEDKILLHQTSPYQNIILSQNKRGETSLFLNWEIQFKSGLLDKVYHETFAHPVMAYLDGQVKNILILGGGDGLLLREIFKYKNVETVAMVDIDPVITEIAKSHPVFTALNENSMSDPRLKIINADAFTWLLRRSKNEKLFDAIFIDFPDATDDALKRLYSREFYMLVKRNLKADGIAVVQANILPSQPHEVIRKTLKEAGLHVLTLHSPPSAAIPDPEGMFDSAFVVASPSLAVLEELYQAVKNRPLSLPLDLSTLNSQNLHQVLDPYIDTGETDSASANSLFRPVHFGFQRGLFTRFLQMSFTPPDS